MKSFVSSRDFKGRRTAHTETSQAEDAHLTFDFEPKYHSQTSHHPTDMTGLSFTPATHTQTSFMQVDESKSGHKAYALNNTSIITDLIYLKTLAHKKKTGLGTRDSDRFFKIVNMSVSIAGTQQYNDFMDLVVDVFGDIKTPERGTVGDFFVGCVNSSQRGGDHGCSAECAGNLPRKGYTVKDFCGTHVGVYDGSLTVHYSPPSQSDIILIHSNTRDFKMNKHNASDLKKKGITKVIMSYYDNDMYTSNGMTVNIDEMPLDNTHKDRNTPNKHEPEDNWLWIFFIIVLVVLIIIVIVYCCLFASMGAATRTSTSSHSSTHKHTALY